MIVAFALSLLAADPPKAAPGWTPRDKEMVVLLGSAFIEQEARDGYLETELIRLFPKKDIRVRNLGWSGDTVHCQARAYFGPPQEGFERLRGHLQMIKPTTVICCYGANESWRGEPGIPEFRKGYEKLIDMIRETTGATVVLMTPPPFEPFGPAKTELESAHLRLKRYWQEIKYVSEQPKCSLICFGEQFAELGEGVSLRTENGVQYRSPWGYRTAANRLWDGLVDDRAPIVNIKFQVGTVEGKNTEISNVAKSPQSISWQQQDERLPDCGVLSISVLKTEEAGWKWECRIDDKPVNFRTSATGSLDPIDVPPKTPRPYLKFFGPEFSQLELLRQAIVKKNAHFFHRWRPANETYLFGFRKHEQGNNGVEPPMFDKLVEQAEAEIAVLKKPVAHKYELIRVEEKK